MKTRCVAGAALCVAFATHSLAAHGGQYRGPGDRQPPGNGRGASDTQTGGSGPTTGGTTGTAGGASSTPRSGLPAGPTTPAARRGATTPLGYSIGTDPSQWQVWWEFNKDRYLRLQDAVQHQRVMSGSDIAILGRGLKSAASDALAPSAHDLDKVVLPALERALRDPRSNRDVLSSCMVALARIGRNPRLAGLLRPFLAHRDQEERETAALALGISADPAAAPDLIALALDTDRGRTLTKRAAVDYRTRAFALYGLGLIAHQACDNGLNRRALATARHLLDPDRRVREDIRVAALHCLRLVPVDASQAAGRLFQRDAVTLLLEVAHDDSFPPRTRAHAWTALASLAQADDAVRRRVLTAARATITNRRAAHELQQSAVLACGRLGRAEDGVGAVLRSYVLTGKDRQARYFAAIALGQIGGSKNRAFLEERLDAEETQAILTPWLALGLAEFARGAEAAHSSFDAAPIGRRILARFETTRSPDIAAGLAIAIGIVGYDEAGPALFARLKRLRNQDEAGGYVAVALGLLRYREASDAIRSLAAAAKRRDVLLTQTAIALGLLGDKEVASRLTAQLGDTATVAVRSALAKALGYIGDRHALAALVRQLDDGQLDDLPRAFAAVALGLIADKSPLPWNSAVALDANYRATVETLVGGGAGILDIL